MATWIDALARTRKSITGAIARIFAKPDQADGDTLDELEAALIAADVPVKLVSELTRDLGKGSRGSRKSPRDVIRSDLICALGPTPPFSWNRQDNPLTILVVGVNGSGKTTTSAKLACAAQQAGRRPLLGATDTFRAAGADQLKLWAGKVACDVVAGTSGADAAAVAFDAMDAALSREADVLIIDTAGRMHTRQPLMQELQKVRRALSKKMPSAPHETWIVLDATMGHNAITQARVFHEAVPLTGAVVAKLDGSSKAGFVFSIAQDLGVPVRFVGLGEGAGDLVPFDAEAFVDALLELTAMNRSNRDEAQPARG